MKEPGRLFEPTSVRSVGDEERKKREAEAGLFSTPTIEGFPTGRFGVIYADPPWSYELRPYGKYRQVGMEDHYQTETLEWICNLPVSSVAADDCVLFLWATSPLLEQGFQVIRAWGFEFRTVAFVWSKRGDNGKPLVNPGRWTMGNVEIVLLARKGKPKRAVAGVRQFVPARRGRHSEKPDEVRQRIELLMGPDVAKLELFARRRYKGWTSWGNQLPPAGEFSLRQEDLL